MNRVTPHGGCLAAAAFVGLLWSTCATAGSGDAKAGSGSRSSDIQQTGYAVGPVMGLEMCPAEPFAEPSKYYGPWEPTEIFGRDARCQPTPFAPRGYGFPKKLSAYRMDYTPYRVRDCGLGSTHGPSLWLRRHRDPCCDPVFGGCRCCNRGVDPQ